MRAEQFFSLSFFSSLSGRSRELCGSFSFQADEQFRGLLAADQGIVHLDCRSNSKINAAEGTISKGYFQSPSAIYPTARAGCDLWQIIPLPSQAFGRRELAGHAESGSQLLPRLVAASQPERAGRRRTASWRAQGCPGVPRWQLPATGPVALQNQDQLCCLSVCHYEPNLDLGLSEIKISSRSSHESNNLSLSIFPYSLSFSSGLYQVATIISTI